MENKINGRMGAISTSIADSTATRVSDLIEAGYSNTKLPTESHSLPCAASSVRNFGNADTLIHGLTSSGDGAVFKDCNIPDGSLPVKQFYDRSGEHLKCDGVPWEDLVKAQRTNVATSASLPGESLSLSTTTGACKFIKDENEPSMIMDTHCPSFDPSSEIPALGACCDTDLKQQLGLSDGEPSNFMQSVAGPGLEGSPNFLIDLNQSEHLPGQVRTNLSGKAVMNFDSKTHAHSQLTVYKNEASRWQMQTSPSDPQYWCQTAVVPETPFTSSGYDGLQSLSLCQKNPSPFSVFPSMPPQRQCVICGDEASGCHYGVLTCGSCKVFFKRAVEGHHSYLCAGRNDCIVDKIRRKNSPYILIKGRKLKRYGALKALGLVPSLMFQSHLAMSSDNQALNPMPCRVGICEVQLNQQIVGILENIEPEDVHSGYDNPQPDVPHLLLSTLNHLCEKQLLSIVKWSKALPGFRNLHINDQMTLIQYSWMNLMVFSLGWRSFQNVSSEFLYIAPDLVLNQDQMRRSPIYELCMAIQLIPQEFAKLQVTREEFLCMKAIILLNTVPLEGLKSQAAFEEMRQSYIHELTKVIHMKEKGVVASSQRFYHLTKLLDSIHEIVKKVNLYCLSTFLQAETMRVEFPAMMSEVIASQLPKVLAGMVRPLLFHTK
uniref:progesterone receptor isoform X2 n=1 Tax=Monopterus albus TaxID=43700 RepID=UPI0009B3090C|nr:progesterone receptor isoform X2 [Monopterus albus]